MYVRGYIIVNIFSTMVLPWNYLVNYLFNLEKAVYFVLRWLSSSRHHRSSSISYLDTAGSYRLIIDCLFSTRVPLLQHQAHVNRQFSRPQLNMQPPPPPPPPPPASLQTMNGSMEKRMSVSSTTSSTSYTTTTASSTTASVTNTLNTTSVGTNSSVHKESSFEQTAMAP